MPVPCLDCGRRVSEQGRSRCRECRRKQGRGTYEERYGPGWRQKRERFKQAWIETYGLWCAGWGDHAGHFVDDRADLDVDHVVPRVRGGSNEDENLQCLCGPANRAKGARA